MKGLHTIKEIVNYSKWYEKPYLLKKNLINQNILKL